MVKFRRKNTIVYVLANTQNSHTCFVFCLFFSFLTSTNGPRDRRASKKMPNHPTEYKTTGKRKGTHTKMKWIQQNIQKERIAVSRYISKMRCCIYIFVSYLFRSVEEGNWSGTQTKAHNNIR